MISRQGHLIQQLFLSNKGALIFFLIPLFSFSFLIDRVEAQEVRSRKLTIQTGMPSNVIRCLHKGPRGYMWIGTSSGLVRYDGTRKKVYTTNDGLPSNKIWAIADGPEGNLWIGTYGGGTVYFDGDEFHRPSGDTVEAPKHVRTLYHHRTAGRVFAGGENGFASMTTDTLYQYLKKPKGWDKDRFQIGGFFSLGKDSVIVMPIYGKGRAFGIGSTMSRSRIMGSPFNCTSVSSLEKGDSMIIGGQGLRIVEGGRTVLDFPPFRKYWNNKKGAIWDITANGKGDLWAPIWGANVGSDGALFRVDSNGYHPVSHTYGIDSEKFWSCEYDRENEVLFVGTLGDGLYIVPPEILEFRSIPSPLTEKRPSLTKANGSLWLFGGGRIGKFEEGQFLQAELPDLKDKVRSIKGKKELDNWKVTALYYHDHRYWIGSPHGLIQLDQDLNFKAFHPANMSGASYLDEKGRLWVVPQYKPLRLIQDISNPSEKTRFDSGKVPVDVTHIDKDEADRMWFGSWAKGLYTYDGERFRNFRKGNSELSNNHITAMEVIGKGKGILSTNDGRTLIALVQKDSLHLLYEFKGQHAPSGSHIYWIQKGEGKRLWIGTEKGIDVYRFHEGWEAPPYKLTLGEAVGYERAGSWNPIKTSNGIYFLREKELVRIDPGKIESVKKRERRIFFEEVSVNRNPIQEVTGDGLHRWEGTPHQVPELSYHQNAISFSYHSLGMKSGDRIRYQYRLLGSDSAWSPLMKQGQQTFPGLKPGQYKFEVRTVDLTLPQQSVRTQFPFVIHPPWWRTHTFYVSAGAVFILFIFTGVKYRERKLQRQKMILEQKVQERTRELREANESIQEQKEQLEEKNKEINDSINYAWGIQNTLLPSEEKLKEDLGTHFVLFLPKEQVSGDFYWSEALEDGRGFWMAADCTGHGVPGAFMSMISHRLLNEAVRDKGLYLPGSILDWTKDQLTEMMSYRSGEESKKDGMDTALCGYDPNKGVLIYAGAQNPLYLIRQKQGDGSIELPEVKDLTNNTTLTVESKELKQIEEGRAVLLEVKGDRISVSADEERHSFRTVELKVQKGDQLYTFSDGFADQFGGKKDKKYRYKPFKRFLLSISHLPLEDQREALREEFYRWKGDLEQIDDVCIMGKRIE